MYYIFTDERSKYRLELPSRRFNASSATTHIGRLSPS
jgi:hypothetical protein